MIAARTTRGFTLLELLVAMFIAAVMFAMGYGAINQALISRGVLQEQQARLIELQTAVRVLEQDFIQLAPRPVRQPVGDSWQPALQGDPNQQPFLQLTRGGWANPTGLQRPGLQRVAYFVENNTLRREYWPVLDPTLASKTIKRDLLTHVKTVTIRYMDVSRQWQVQWPGTGVGDETQLRLRPLAVEITLETEDWGKLVRIIEVAA
jgi:general secretion pathway protein J